MIIEMLKMLGEVKVNIKLVKDSQKIQNEVAAS